MTALTASIITAVVTAILAAAGTYLTTRRNLQIQFDASLRDLRIDTYKLLWKDLDPLAKYARSRDLTKSDVHDLSRTLRHWYFHEGGIFLSVETRSAYFALQDAFEVVGNDDRELERKDDEFLRVLASRLRTAMTRDVGTRRTFIFRGTEDGVRPQDERRLPGAGFYVTEQSKVDLQVSYRRRLRLPRWPRLLDVVTVVEGPVYGQRLGAGRQFVLDDGRVLEGPQGLASWRRPN